MASGQLDGVLHHLRQLVTAGQPGPRPDRELLERFVRHRDEAAFAALVRRHGPMVLAVCRRVLGDAHDAEDACQAAFLVLARRAASIRRKEAVGAWLHGVAYRVACNLKRQVARRHAREGAVLVEPVADGPEPSWREVLAVLDEELGRLPERFRAPLLLCYLEGKTRDEAAQALGWSPGTLRGRLERGREMLRARLTRRGLTLSAALLVALLAQHAARAALPAALAGRIIEAGPPWAAGRAAAGLIPPRAVALAKGVVHTMLLTRLKIAAAVVLVVGLVGFRLAVLADGPWSPPKPAVPTWVPPPAPEPPPATLSAEADGPEQPEDRALLARNEAQSRDNLKQIALAMHNYNDVNGYFPAPAIYAGEKVPGAMGGSASGPSSPGEALLPGGAPGAGPVGGGAAAPTAGGMAGGAPSGLNPGKPRPPMYGPGLGMPAGPLIVGKDGKALLSWRVALLPYLEQDALYREFHLDEPWDSPHNKKLLAQVPKVYAPPGVTTREPYTTFYQVFVGPHAAFEKHRALRIFDFTDGTSNTLLVVEAGSAVPWTKPEDLHFAPDEPLPELGGLFPGIFHAALADGSVNAFSKNADPDALRAAITRDQGEVVDFDRLRAPRNPRQAELRQQNERLKEELDKERATLEELRREKQLLQEPDPATEQLKKENARLEQLLRQTRDEVERLREEIRRLK